MKTLSDIRIRTKLQPDGIDFITYLHGMLYRREYNYSIAFEAYVAKGLCKFMININRKKTGYG